MDENPDARAEASATGWSVRSERERLMRSCPARAAALARAEQMTPLPAGVAGEVLRRRRLGLRADEPYIEQLHRAFAAAGPLAAKKPPSPAGWAVGPPPGASS